MFKKQSHAIFSYICHINSAREKAIINKFKSRIKIDDVLTKKYIKRKKKYITFPFCIVFFTNIHCHSQNLFFKCIK